MKTCSDHNMTTTLNHETLYKKTVQMLLNELFSLNKDTNDRILKEDVVNKNTEFG